MAKLVVELPEENKRFIVRYPQRATVLLLLEQNAETVEEIVPTQFNPASIPPDTPSTRNAAHPSPAPESKAEVSEPLNDDTATRAATALIEEYDLNIAEIPADGGRVGKAHVDAFLETLT